MIHSRTETPVMSTEGINVGAGQQADVTLSQSTVSVLEGLPILCLLVSSCLPGTRQHMKLPFSVNGMIMVKRNQSGMIIQFPLQKPSFQSLRLRKTDYCIFSDKLVCNAPTPYNRYI